MNYKYGGSKMCRALDLLSQYKRLDKKASRGEGDLTARWIVENIFAKPCAHCGKQGWHIIGCNRLDNSKPHSKDNVEPCCFKCNAKINGKELSKQVYQYTFDGELVKIWNSITDIERRYGFAKAAISYCCNGRSLSIFFSYSDSFLYAHAYVRKRNKYQ